MSRIGKLPINLPSNVEVKVSSDNTVTVKGPKGSLDQKVDVDMQIKWADLSQLVDFVFIGLHGGAGENGAGEGGGGEDAGG